MPFKSQAQRRKLGQLVREGKFSQKQFDEFSRDTPKKLPKRVTPKKRTTRG